MAIEMIQTAKPTQRIRPAKGIHEACPNALFRILDTSFSKKPIVLQKHLCMALGTSSPECIVELEPNKWFKPTVQGNAVHYKKVEDRKTHLEPHMMFEHDDAER